MVCSQTAYLTKDCTLVSEGRVDTCDTDFDDLLGFMLFVVVNPAEEEPAAAVKPFDFDDGECQDACESSRSPDGECQDPRARLRRSPKTPHQQIAVLGLNERQKKLISSRNELTSFVTRALEDFVLLHPGLIFNASLAGLNFFLTKESSFLRPCSARNYTPEF